ncbi:MAG: hypothetical protein ACTSVE_00020 [Candidatus Helarchaeota archaeon]
MSIEWDVIFHETCISFKLIEITFILFYALFFLNKLKKKEETRNQKEIYFGTSFFLISYLISDIFFFFAYYGMYFGDLLFYYQSWKIASIIGLIGTTFFIFTIEKNIDLIKKLNTHFLFTFISIGLIITVLLTSVDLGRLIAYISLPILFLLVLFFHFYIFLKAPQEYKKDLFLSFFGFLLFLVSYTIPTEIAQRILNVSIDPLLIISSSLIIFGIGIYTLKIPPNAELEWHQKIITLFIIHLNKGLRLFDYSFRAAELDEQSDLIAGGIVGISSIIQEITESETNLKIIKQEKANIILESGKFATVALIANEDLQILRKKLKTLIKRFEKMFSIQLAKWTGNIETFLPAKVLVEEIFEVPKFFHE